MQRFEECRLREAAELRSSELRDRTQRQGLCAGDPEHADDWFLPEPATTSTGARLAYEREAERLCSPCPVRAECLEVALRNEVGRPSWGIWGGLAPWQRVLLIRARRSVAQTEVADATSRALAGAA